ncbi:DUF3046 domain-containing protein [Leifsonia sp. YIM 134122]|uniref:DUF3046 domain-containing protein n=1 Tax=Leifsonia stereocauli TaxID=3134136 RepID=A0ABU9W2R2_9MICO|nr:MULTISPECIES: DUF3046 domain-containing protein [unclassified Leifsonia]KQQ95592.1 signal transduction histidine kinase [Leifsonia sp. Leaf325]KQX06642.1 signal transduction histidine kinase [Leifsonia sp. Root1293]KRA10926.1 signal transduction histidine kinase [Leifsonia sp. Root60]
MKSSEFRLAVQEEFGDAYGRSLLRDLVLPDLGNVTGDEALAAGTRPRDVWYALCAAMDVPENRRHGAGLREPRR